MRSISRWSLLSLVFFLATISISHVYAADDKFQTTVKCKGVVAVKDPTPRNDLMEITFLTDASGNVRVEQFWTGGDELGRGVLVTGKAGTKSAIDFSAHFVATSKDKKTEIQFKLAQPENRSNSIDPILKRQMLLQKITSVSKSNFSLSGDLACEYSGANVKSKFVQFGAQLSSADSQETSGTDADPVR